MTRDEKLLQVIALLWEELPEPTRQRITPIIDRLGATWALPTAGDETDWITTVEAALEFGLTPSSIRTNWPRQYGVRPVNDRWLRRDIELVRLKRHLKGHVA